jgi:hypothetical protein
MDAIVLLADWAEAINGKLYIQGGGWSRVAAPQVPQLPAGYGIVQCALAIRFLVGWDEANEPHEVTIRLMDADGNPVSPLPGQPPIEIKTQIEVGRPPGSIKGSDIDAAFAVKFGGIPLQKGRYQFVLEIGGEPLKTGAIFNVI